MLNLQRRGPHSESQAFVSFFIWEKLQDGSNYGNNYCDQWWWL